MKDVHSTIMYTDDLDIVADNKQELQGEQEEWKEVFKSMD